MYTAKTAQPLIRLIFLFCSGVALLYVSACQPQRVVQQRFLQFGTLIDITLVSPDESRARQIFSDIEILLKKRHFEWHGWEDGSLQQFNQSLAEHPSIGIKVPQTLDLLVTESKKYFELSEGLFNPAMGRLIDAWGFHKQATPDHALIQKIKTNLPGMDDLVLKNNLAYSLNPNLQLDFGAIAKGLGVRQIADLINQNQVKDFIINAGGDIFAQGQKQGHNWRIAIENPFTDELSANGLIASIDITEPVSVFTSGNYRRFYMDENNTRRHHIINPVTGEPSINISSVTVLHQDPVVADVAATTLMLTDTFELARMANKLDIPDFLVITQQHEAYISRSMMSKIEWVEPKTLKIHLL